jgi:hypothetical protein
MYLMLDRITRSIRNGHKLLNYTWTSCNTIYPWLFRYDDVVLLFFNAILPFKQSSHVRNHRLASNAIDATNIYPNSEFFVACKLQPHRFPFYSPQQCMRDKVSTKTDKTYGTLQKTSHLSLPYLVVRREKIRQHYRVRRPQVQVEDCLASRFRVHGLCAGNKFQGNRNRWRGGQHCIHCHSVEVWR